MSCFQGRLYLYLLLQASIGSDQPADFALFYSQKLTVKVTGDSCGCELRCWICQWVCCFPSLKCENKSVHSFALASEDWPANWCSLCFICCFYRVECFKLPWDLLQPLSTSNATQIKRIESYRLYRHINDMTVPGAVETPFLEPPRAAAHHHHSEGDLSISGNMFNSRPIQKTESSIHWTKLKILE